jgi:hypothetical protein
MPAMQMFVAGGDLKALLFAHGQTPGKFEFELDDLEIR